MKGRYLSEQVLTGFGCAHARHVHTSGGLAQDQSTTFDRRHIVLSSRLHRRVQRFSVAIQYLLVVLVSSATMESFDTNQVLASMQEQKK